MILHEGPVYVYYTSRGKRVRKHFESGTAQKCHRFYTRMERKGRKPKLVPACDVPTLFPEDSR